MEERQEQRRDITILTAERAADYLGISKRRLYDMCKAGQLSYSKPTHKLLYFIKDDLDDWMLQNRKESTHPIDRITIEIPRT